MFNTYIKYLIYKGSDQLTAIPFIKCGGGLIFSKCLPLPLFHTPTVFYPHPFRLPPTISPYFDPYHFRLPPTISPNFDPYQFRRPPTISPNVYPYHFRRRPLALLQTPYHFPKFSPPTTFDDPLPLQKKWNSPKPYIYI